MTVYVCVEYVYEYGKGGGWQVIKVVKDELSAIRWCGNDGYRRYEECELEDS